MAVLVILRFTTKAAVRCSLKVAAAVMRSTTACALQTSCGDGCTGIRIRSAARMLQGTKFLVEVPKEFLAQGGELGSFRLQGRHEGVAEFRHTWGESYAIFA